MKKILVSVLLMIMVSLIVNAASDFEIVKEDINPSVIEPGKELTLTVSVWNKKSDIKEMKIELLEEFPFTIKSTSQNFADIFELCSGCKRSNTYYLTVDHAAVSGMYKLNFMVTEGGSGFKRSIDIEIKGKSDLVFEVLEMEESITPNSEFEAKLKLTNTGTGIARDIKLEAGSDEFFLKGNNVLSLGELEASATKTFTLSFLAGSSVEKDVYSIPVKLTYQDHDGNKVESTQEISARVLDKAKLNLKEVKIEPGVIKPGKEITIQVRIENVGEGDAKNIKLKLESEIEGNKEAYLGRLEKEDDSPAFFTGKVLSSGEKTDRLTITYFDDLGEHSETEEIKYTVRGISTATWIIIVLVIIILALAGLLVLSYFYMFCKCHIQGKKCPKFKQHITQTIETVKGAFNK